MSMTTEQVLQYASKMHENDSPSNAEENQNSNNDNPSQNQNPEENKPVPPVTSAEETDPKTSGDNTASETVKSDKNPEATPEEKNAHAFSRLKKQEKAKREKLIKDYESQIVALKAENEKFKNLSKDSFKTEEEYEDAKLDNRINQRDLKALEAEKARAEEANFLALNEERIQNCFPDEKEREIYNKLIKTSAPQFAQIVEQHDPEGVVFSYLDDCDIAPLVIRVMMTKPEYRNMVLSKKNPHVKLMELEKLTNLISNAKSMLERKSGTKPKSDIPIIGNVTKTDSSGQVDTSDKNALLAQLNANRRH